MATRVTTLWCYVLPWMIIVVVPPFSNASDLKCSSTSEKVQVHLVPHTHDDVGWLKTVDQYYYGVHNDIQRAGVQYILDSVVSLLNTNDKHNRTFIYVEMAFFKHWWDEQTEETQALVRKMLERGQLEFIGGGWCMNDEATAFYTDIIDQMSLGLRFINSTFGPAALPSVAWQIDPFGHSAENAALFAQMGFKGLFLGRIDYQDKEIRRSSKNMEFIWQASRNSPETGSIFTDVLFNNYSPPPGLCFDLLCDQEPIVDDPNSPEYNAQYYVDLFLLEACAQASFYKTNHILMTMGEDFNYQNAEFWYKNLDKLIDNVNKDGRVHAFYSTPTRYLKALQQQNVSWNTYTDDFFPYAHRPHSYWTGFYTSRAAFKGYVRETSNILQACKQMEALGRLDAQKGSRMLQEAMATAQHHDAITGTAKQAVSNDYTRRLFQGREQCRDTERDFLSVFCGQQSGSIHCDYLNISSCVGVQDLSQYTVVLYNPMSWVLEAYYLRLPVRGIGVNIVNPFGDTIRCDSFPVPKADRDLFRAYSLAKYVAYCPVNLGPLGFSAFNIVQSQSDRSAKLQDEALPETISNEYIRLTVDPNTGLFQGAAATLNGWSIDMPLKMQLLWYNASVDDYQPSGAYIFRPNTSDAVRFPVSSENVTYNLGGRVQEMTVTFSNYSKVTTRLFRQQPYVELEYTVGPIPVADGWGKEVILRIDSNVASEAVLFVDSNGREIKKKVRDQRSSWVLNVSEPASGNYYPMNTFAAIRDSRVQLTLVPDRAVGVASIADGSIEVMLHRRLLRDDYLGVSEALNEPGDDPRGLIVRGKLLLYITSPEHAVFHVKPGIRRHVSPPIYSFLPERNNLDHGKCVSLMNSSLPPNVHLLSLEATAPDRLLMRLEHIYEHGEDFLYSRDVTVNVENLFQPFRVISLVELDLSAAQLKPEGLSRQGNRRQLHGASKVILKPFEIRTFEATVKYSF